MGSSRNQTVFCILWVKNVKKPSTERVKGMLIPDWQALLVKWEMTMHSLEQGISYEVVFHFWEAGFKLLVTTWVQTWHTKSYCVLHDSNANSGIAYQEKEISHLKTIIIITDEWVIESVTMVIKNKGNQNEKIPFLQLNDNGGRDMSSGNYQYAYFSRRARDSRFMNGKR